MELRYRWKLGHVKNRNKLNEWKAFVDAVGIKGAEFEKWIPALDFYGCL